MFDDKFQKILVTKANLFPRQTIDNEQKKWKMDDTWYPVTFDEMKALLL